MAYRGSGIPSMGLESPIPYHQFERLSLNPFNGPTQVSSGTPTPTLATFNRQFQFGTDPFSSVPYGQTRPGEPQTAFPVSLRTQSAPVQRLLREEVENLPRGPQRLSDVKRSLETVALPSEMPLGSYVHLREPPQWGVVKISNVSPYFTNTGLFSLTTAKIPYSITKQEIVQFVGRQAQLISSDKGCSIHIIMERSTAKTMDCYVEFESHANAEETVKRINRIYETGRPPRLGNRHVDVELSNQDALLEDLFPRTKCVMWRGGVPYAMANTDRYSTGFAGFLTSEEIVGAIRHAEIPHRVSISCLACLILKDMS